MGKTLDEELEEMAVPPKAPASSAPDVVMDDVQDYLTDMKDTGELKQILDIMESKPEEHPGCDEFKKLIASVLAGETLSPYNTLRLAWFLVAIYDQNNMLTAIRDDGMSDVEADADTLKSAGHGTDEDYRPATLSE